MMNSFIRTINEHLKNAYEGGDNSNPLECVVRIEKNKHLKPPGCMWLDYASLARKNELEAIQEVFWLYSWDGVNISKRVYLS